MNKNDIEKEYMALQQRVTDARVDFDYWTEALAAPPFARMLEYMQEGIDAKTLRLRDFLKADETLTLRAQILASRELVAWVESKASGDALAAARAAEHDYYNANSLFLGQQGGASDDRFVAKIFLDMEDQIEAVGGQVDRSGAVPTITIDMDKDPHVLERALKAQKAKHKAERAEARAAGGARGGN